MTYDLKKIIFIKINSQLSDSILWFSGITIVLVCAQMT